MNRHSASLLASLLMLGLVLTGCAPFKQYRTNYDLCANPTPDISPACQPHALQRLPAGDSANYLLNFIEFDDQGQLWDRKQMWSVIDKLSTEAASKDLLMVVFVHGWQHNAAPNDFILEKFRSVLAKLSEDEALISRQTGLPAREVAGIYLGWRGESISVPYIKGATFWDRKNTAEKVGHGGVTEVLNRLELLKHDKDSTMQGKSGTRLVIVGHSFGGAIVQTALAQILEERFIHTTGPAGSQSDAESFGNLVVLINAAFEAELFAPLSDMSTERGIYFASQLPIMAVLASEADTPNSKLFPVGRFFSTLFEENHNATRHNAVTRQDEIIDEGVANTRAIGHFAPYTTHRLYPATEVARENVQRLSSSDSLSSALSASAAWENDKPGSKIPIAGLTLERTTASAGRNPYLVISVDGRLITEHNDIDDPRIIEFLRQLIAISAQPAERKGLMSKALAIPKPPQ